MCGFSGIVSSHFNKNLTDKGSDNLNKILRHRGPDSSGFFTDNNVRLIHNRLSIIDLSEEANQPMCNPDTGNIIVFNGEIYNYQELKKTYNRVSWRTNSDTEVILKLYCLLGEGFVEKLNGIFSFAIYDKRNNKILLGRDRFGVKPIYYAKSNNGFFFSSEIKAMLQFIPCEINLCAVYDYLEYGRLAHNNMTFFKNIYALEPAHLLRYDLANDEFDKSRYWDIDQPSSKSNVSSIDDIIERTHYELRTSMQLNMVSDVEVAISLSSGIDSTMILKLAQERTDNLKAFTFGFEEQEYDEISRIRQQDSLNGVNLYPIYLKRADMLPLLKDAVYYFETPLGGVGTLSAYNMMKEVRRNNIKVMLAGEGADEIFGGYKYYYTAFFKDIESDPDLLGRELKKYGNSHAQKIELWSKEYYEMTGSINQDIVLAPDGTGATISHVSKYLRDKVSGNTSFKSKKFPSNLCQAMYDDLTVKKLPKLLHFQDRAGMASSVETRVPFLDHNLVEFLYGLPGNYKIRNGQNKYLIKTILKKSYGYTDCKKTKHYVSTPQREWLKSKRVLEEIIDTVKSGNLASQGLIDVDRFENDYRKYAKSPKLGNSFFAWKIINLEYLLGQKWN